MPTMEEKTGDPYYHQRREARKHTKKRSLRGHERTCLATGYNDVPCTCDRSEDEAQSRVREEEVRIKRGKQSDLEDMTARMRKLSGKGPSRGKAQREPVTSIAKVMQDRSRKNSRTKGSRGELDVAKMFSEWCGEHVRRTPMSGGWSNAKFGVTADLVCPKKAFPFHVEVKHREGWTLDDLVTGAREEHDKSIVQWWVQCLTSCPHQKDMKFTKVPLLVFRRNRQPWLAMVHLEDVEADGAKLPMERTIEVKRFGSVVTLLSDLLKHWPVPKGLKNGAS